MNKYKLRYSVVVPIYNDAYLAREFCVELSSVMGSYSGSGSFEIVFINDGSRDDSLQTLLKLREEFNFVRIIDLSRNFGQHPAIASGMMLARGDVIIRMNVDMQDPPDEIPKLINSLLGENLDLVVGQYSIRQSPWITRFTAKLYFILFRLLTGFDVPQNTSSLRVMSRRFVEAYNSLTEKFRFPQGLDQWLGFRHKYIEIRHQPRIDERSSYNIFSRSQLALNGVLYFTDRPLQIVAIIGFVLAIFGMGLAVYIVIERFLGVVNMPGYASLAAIGLVAFGAQLSCLGLVGLYVAKIFREVQNRPLYIVRETFDKLPSDFNFVQE